MSKKIIITIGRQFGSGGREIGKKVAAELNIPFYDKELLVRAARESGLSDSFLQEYDEKPTRSFLYSLAVNPQTGISMMNTGKTVGDMAFEAQRDALYHVADEGSCVIVGRGADYILKKEYPVLSIFIDAEPELRISRVMERDQLSRAEAEKKIHRVDRARAAFYNGYSDQRWGDAATYDMCFRQSDVLTTDAIADIIVQIVKGRIGE